MDEKLKVFLDGTIFNVMLSRFDCDMKVSTLEFLNECMQHKYDVFIPHVSLSSEVTVGDASRVVNCLTTIKPMVVGYNNLTDALAKYISDYKIFPENRPNLCCMLAMALENGCDYFVTWDVDMQKCGGNSPGLLRTVDLGDYSPITIISPPMLLYCVN